MKRCAHARVHMLTGGDHRVGGHSVGHCCFLEPLHESIILALGNRHGEEEEGIHIRFGEFVPTMVTPGMPSSTLPGSILLSVRHLGRRHGYFSPTFKKGHACKK